MHFKDISTVSFINLWRTYKQNKKQLHIILISIFAVAIIYSLITPYQYDADASIMPPKQQNNALNLSSIVQSSGLGTLSGLGGMQQSNLSLLYSSVIKSRSVTNFIIDSLKLKKTSFFKNVPKYKFNEVISDALDVIIDKSGVIFVTASVRTSYFPTKVLKDSAALLASQIANTSILGLDYVLRQRNNSISAKTKDFIGKEIRDYSIKLDSIQFEIEKFQENNKVLEIEEQTKAIVLQANQLAAELAKAEVELNITKNLYSENAQTVKTLEESYNILKNQFSKIQSGGLTSTDNFSIPLNKVPKLIRQYTNLIREQKLYEQILVYLRTIYYQEALQEKKDVPQIDILDWSVVPEKESFPSYKLILAFTLLLELFVILIYLLYKTQVQTQEINSN
jgi:capsule polysaccharide export protein KpsE/RkpR